MNSFIDLFAQMDLILLPVFRFPGHDVLGYFMGTFLLNLACVMIGRYSILLALRFNKKTVSRDVKESVRFQELSIYALKSGDTSAYKACNSQANDAFGRTFFMQIALSAASLWPVFIALGWMQYRFSGIRLDIPVFPGKWISFGYLFSFVLCYAAARILLSVFLKAMPLIRRPGKV